MGWRNWNWILICATWYYHAIYIVFTYVASFTGYENDTFEVISNLHVQGSKFSRKSDKFGGKSVKNWAPQSSWSLFFPSLGTAYTKLYSNVSVSKINYWILIMLFFLQFHRLKWMFKTCDDFISLHRPTERDGDF